MQEVGRFRQHGVAGEQGIRERADEACRPGSEGIFVLRAAESRHQGPGVENVDHARLERIAFRTFSLVAGGAFALTLPSRSSQGEPRLACTACTRCRTALRANSLRSSPTSCATFCQTSFSRPGILTVSVSLMFCV